MRYQFEILKNITLDILELQVVFEFGPNRMKTVYGSCAYLPTTFKTTILTLTTRSLTFVLLQSALRRKSRLYFDSSGATHSKIGWAAKW